MTSKSPKTLIFDVNETLLDLSKLQESVAEALSGGEEVVSLWFETMLHYSLVANATGKYHNFGDIGAAALIMLAGNRNMEMNKSRAQDVLAPIHSTPAHRNVPPALKNLSDKGYRLAVLTNSSREVMEKQLKHAEIGHYFEKKMSVEDIGIYKPDRHVYQWAARKMDVAAEDCLFIAAHGWDIAGAMAAGMQTAFLNRPGQNVYPLTPEPMFVEPGLAQLASKLLNT